jgi:hypothetical protein
MEEDSMHTMSEQDKKTNIHAYVRGALADELAILRRGNPDATRLGALNLCWHLSTYINCDDHSDIPEWALSKIAIFQQIQSFMGLVHTYHKIFPEYLMAEKLYHRLAREAIEIIFVDDKTVNGELAIEA